MGQRIYYSSRTGKNPNSLHFDLAILKRLFRDTYHDLNSKGYFQEMFGYECVDAGFVPGTLGSDIDAQIFRLLRKDSLWPIEEKSSEYSEDDLFDIIEFLHDYISKPLEGHFHSWGMCGWHYETFNKEAGQQEFRNLINILLKDYQSGYELTDLGEIMQLADIGLVTLLNAKIPTYDPENVDIKVQNAIKKFRNWHSTNEDRKDAIRDLVDVFEYLRPQVHSVLQTKDENDIFNIANNFGIRHHNQQQKTEYDPLIWNSWMFYYYLCTYHACIRLIKKAQPEKK